MRAPQGLVRVSATKMLANGQDGTVWWVRRGACTQLGVLRAGGPLWPAGDTEVQRVPDPSSLMPWALAQWDVLESSPRAALLETGTRGRTACPRRRPMRKPRSAGRGGEQPRVSAWPGGRAGRRRGALGVRPFVQTQRHPRP